MSIPSRERVRGKDKTRGIRDIGLSPRLKLALLAGVSSLVVISVIGCRAQSFLFWLRFTAAPLAVATLVGVLLSRKEECPSATSKIIVVAITPLIAFLSFLGTYLISTILYSQHYTPRIVDIILAIAYAAALASVRWSVNIIHALRKA